MLIKRNGNCEKCGKEYGPIETVQSTTLICSKCKKKVTRCSSCKQKGCECGGKLLDPWDINPNIMY